MAKTKTEKKVAVVEENDVQQMIDTLAAKGQAALKVLETFDQEKIDYIVHQMAMAGLDQHMPLAKMAVEETGRGIYEDKCIKNMFATESIWNSIKHNKTAGVISDDQQTQITEVATPVGVVCGVTPVTNPTSTTMFKAIISLKTRIQLFLLSIHQLKTVLQHLLKFCMMQQSKQVLLKAVSNGLKNLQLKQQIH